MKFQIDGIKIIISRAKKKIFRTAIIMLIMIVLIIASLLTLNLTNKNKIAHGLKIAEISVGGLAPNEAQAKLENSINEFFKKEIILRYEPDKENKKIWTALPEEMGIKINIETTLDQALKIGHRGKFFPDTGQQILAFFGYYNLSLDCELNEIELEKFIRKKLNSIDRPAVNAEWRYDEKTKNFVLIPSQQGKIIERQTFKIELQQKIKKLTNEEIYLNLVDDYPEILENETKEALIKAQDILKKAPYKLIINDILKIAPTHILLTKEELIPLIEFEPIEDINNPKNKVLGINLNKKAIKNYLTKISPSINRNAINAQLTIQNNKVVNFSLPRQGLKLEIEQSVKKIQEEILKLELTEIPLEISAIPPTTTAADKEINNLGITTLLAKGVSNFAGSPASRIHNIKIGAAKFNGVLLKPNEEFSFNTILGEIGPEQGYKAELVIKKNKTIPEYGGGLCQVSTTAFRAAVNSGLPITERAPHAFPVVYYNPQGFDATIYPPHPDLRFINDTPGYLLIQTKIEDNNLIFEFYGTSDGRKVEIEGPIQYDLKSDGSMKTRLIRRIFDKDGNLIKESIFNSNYKSPSLYPIEKNPLE